MAEMKKLYIGRWENLLTFLPRLSAARGFPEDNKASEMMIIKGVTLNYCYQHSLINSVTQFNLKQIL